jgi:PAS domain S-box-containing protein
VSLPDAKIAGRVLPFAIAAALPFLVTLVFGPSAGSADFIASGILTALLTALALAVPWTGVPVPLRATVPLTFFAVVFLLRNSSAAAAAVYTPLVLLPVIWLALYGTRGQLIAAFLLLALTLIIPIPVFGAPRYPTTEWRRVAIFLMVGSIVGITIHRLMSATRERADRLRASETAIRAGRDMLASVLQASTEYAIMCTDPRGVVTVFNAGAERLLGYSAAEMIGVEAPDILDHAEVKRRARELDIAPGFEVLVAAARRGEPETRDWTYIRKDGGRLTVSLTATAIHGAGSEPAGFIGVARDVTVQRSVEEALQESEARHRLLVQNLPDSLFSLYDQELRLLLVEGAMLARLGLAAEDFVGRTVSEIAQAGRLGDLEPLHRAALAGKSSLTEHQLTREGIAYQLHVAPYRDDAGEIVGVCSVARDITERKRAEAQAQAAEERFAKAFEHSPVGVGISDRDGWFMTVNPALCKLLGYTRDELLKLPPEALTHPDDREAGDALLRSLGTGGLNSYRVYKRYLHADGHPIDVSVHLALVRDGDGKPLHVVGQVVDITDQKRQRTTRERELALTQQAREQLAEQNARLVELDRMKDEFVALVSHELRTPLTSIVGYLEPILDREAGPLTATQERFLKTIDRNARALSTIVGDLLFLASVDAGKLTLQIEDVDLAQLLADTVEACGPAADRRGVTLTIHTDGVPNVRGDRARLAQLTDNLLSNAIKFTPDGGHVDVRGREDGTNAVIEIRDTGVGIPADEVPRLFTRFYRATSATERAISGTGLGLAIVKSITDAHHGAIEVDSSPGVGTTMRVLLPLGANHVDTPPTIATSTSLD